MQDQKQSEVNGTERCSVPGCDKAADFAVLVCVSEMPAVLGLDHSCPHLCTDHVLANEFKAFSYFNTQDNFEEFRRTGNFFPANSTPRNTRRIRTPSMSSHYPFTLKDDETLTDSVLELDSFVVYVPLQSHQNVVAWLEESIQARRVRSTGRALV
jgi:hypothetical protein